MATATAKCNESVRELEQRWPEWVAELRAAHAATEARKANASEVNARFEEIEERLSGVRYLWSQSTFLNRSHGALASGSIFRVLRFHFMARSGLLGKARFEWASCAPPLAHRTRPA